MAVVRAVVDPGSRLLVRFANEAGMDHERLAGWPIDDASWIVATPQLRLVEESARDWIRVLDATGTDHYPEDVEDVEHFSRPIEDFEIADIVFRSRAEANRIREETGRGLPTVLPTAMRSWSGAILVLPAEGGIAALRRRVMGKASNFEVGRRGLLRGATPAVPAHAVLPPPVQPGAVVENRADAVLPVADADANRPPARGGERVEAGLGAGDVVIGRVVNQGERAPRLAPPGAGVGDIDAPDVRPLPGHVWLTSDLTFGLLGVEVQMSPSSVVIGKKGIYNDGQGLSGFVEMVPLGQVSTYVTRLRARYGHTDPRPPKVVTIDVGVCTEAVGPIEPSPGPDLRASIDARLAGTREDHTSDEQAWPEAADAEELRTLYVDYDSAGKRYKEWRKGTDECATYRFGDYPHDGPPECLKFCRAITRDFDNVRRWFQAWCQKYNVGESDRLWHEMSVLVEVLHNGLTYDQLNMGALASFELVVRRVLSIVEHVNSGKESGNWTTSRYLVSRKGPGDIMSRELHRFVGEEAKVDREVAEVRKKAASGLAEAVSSGGLPASPGEGEGGKAAGKGRGAKARARGRGR